VATRATRASPAPQAMPIAAVIQTIAAVVKPRSCILGHAFFLMQKAIGSVNARELLLQVPRALPARREFGDVHRAFEDATDLTAQPELRDEVHQAFIDAGVTTSKRRTDTCPGANP
jgi:hypothetical protein